MNNAGNQNNICIDIIYARRYDTRAINNAKATPERVAEFFEMSYYDYGEGNLYINGVEYPIVPQSIRFVQPGDKVCSMPHFSCFTVVFKVSTSNEVKEKMLFKSIPTYFSFDKSIAAYFNELIYYNKLPDGGGFLMSNSILLKILSKIHTNSINKLQPDAIRKCIEYINENYSDKIALKHLSKLTNYSSIHLCRLFKTAMDITPHEYITKMRMQKAKELLVETDITIDEIAYRCGFRSSPHFKTLFKEVLGCTPLYYRKSMREIQP